jgi:hypothetical protein
MKKEVKITIILKTPIEIYELLVIFAMFILIMHACMSLMPTFSELENEKTKMTATRQNC